MHMRRNAYFPFGICAYNKGSVKLLTTQKHTSQVILGERGAHLSRLFGWRSTQDLCGLSGPPEGLSELQLRRVCHR